MNIFHLLFFISFGSMQLIEYFLWTYLKNPAMNSLISKVGFGLISIQPLFSILQISPQHPLLLGYLGFAVYAAMIFFNPSKFGISFSTEVASNGHLLWNWLPKDTFYNVAYFILLLLPLFLANFPIALGGALLTLFISLYTYHKSGTWGSMWCWMSALFSFWIIGASVKGLNLCK